MLKWTGIRQGIPIIGLGLEEKNLEKLRQDMPIHIKGADMGIAFDIVIYYGKGLEDLVEMTKGGIGPDTIVHDTSRRSNETTK
jgi:hypothetical protein